MKNFKIYIEVQLLDNSDKKLRSTISYLNAKCSGHP